MILKLIKPYWRTSSFSPQEEELVEELFEAHASSTYRANVSSATVINAAGGSGDLTKAIAAALMTLGDRHGPIKVTAEFLTLEHPERLVGDMISRGKKIPGWGNGFVKGEPDPIWVPVHKLLERDWPDTDAKLGRVTETLHRHHDKKIFPNPSAYTAGAGLIMGMSPSQIPFLFIAARLPFWAHLASDTL